MLCPENKDGCGEKLVFLEIDEETGYNVYKCALGCKKEWLDEPVNKKKPTESGRTIICKKGGNDK